MKKIIIYFLFFLFLISFTFGATCDYCSEDHGTASGENSKWECYNINKIKYYDVQGSPHTAACASGLYCCKTTLFGCYNPSSVQCACEAKGWVWSSGTCINPGQPEGNCFDGIDNNANGKIDCLDSTCDGQFCSAGLAICANLKCNEVCYNDYDDDNDTLKDCLDPDCLNQNCGNKYTGWVGGAICNSNQICVETNCSDNRDNDEDGLINFADPDCQNICPAFSSSVLSIFQATIPNWFSSLNGYDSCCGDDSIVLNGDFEY